LLVLKLLETFKAKAQNLNNFCEQIYYLEHHIAMVNKLVALFQDGKMADEDDVLPNGYRVIKGDGMNYMNYAMGMMK
jgi:hypothetical protein